MDKKSLLISCTIILGILLCTYLLTVYSATIKSLTAQLLKVSPQVLGEQAPNALSPPERIATDIKNQTNAIKTFVLDITLGDVLNTLGRSKKIVDDFHTVQVYTQEQLAQIGKPKDGQDKKKSK